MRQLSKWVEWVEPFNHKDDPVFCRVSVETAIATQRHNAERIGRPYSSDKTALEDFMIVHWANYVTEPTVLTEEKE